LSGPSAKQPEQERRTKNRRELHRGKTLPSAHLSGKHHQRSEARFVIRYNGTNSNPFCPSTVQFFNDTKRAACLSNFCS
jgi:hypothetical protein